MAYSYKMKTLFSQVTIVIKISNDFCSILNTVLLYFYDLQKCSFLYVNVTIGALSYIYEGATACIFLSSSSFAVASSHEYISNPVSCL